MAPPRALNSNSVTEMPRQSPVSPPIREFELVVLLAVLGLGDEAYPVSIRDAIEARTRRKVSRAAVFITLERLERKGFVLSRYGDPTPVRGGRAKRFFRPTPDGIVAVKDAVHLMRSMTAGLDEVLE
jgi:DNA-binding PadR family transcriptional regulator